MGRATWGFPGFGIRGRVGGLEFLAAKGGGTIVREVPTVRAARTPLQRASEARMRAVAAAWGDLSLAETEAWEAYVRDPHPALPHGGGGVPAQPYNAFSGLGAKCLQMRPDAPVPRLPPETGFLGDGVVVYCGVSIVESGSEIHNPKSTIGITFSSSAPNAPGVVTELLLQRLASKARKPTLKGYRTQAFVAFAAGSLSAEVPCEPGAYACAIRFVREATGQETAVVPLGKVVELG